MPNKGYVNNFSKGMVLDFSEQVVPENAAIFIKNLTQNVNANPGSPSGAGFDLGEWTPLEGNTQLEVDIPGNSYTIGSFYSAQTNELYYFTYNPSPGNNGVWRIDAQGNVVNVYSGMELPFALNPMYFISEGRCTMELRSYTDPVTGVETNFKFLIFTNGVGDQLFIEVESSIATQSFSAPNVNPGDRFYNPAGAFYDQKELIYLGVPSPLTQIGIVPTQTLDDLILQNNIVREGYQFRVKFIDVFGRESEHGIISDNYISSVGGGCVQSANNQPRCLNVTFGAGNALVQKIAFEFRKWEGDDRGGVIATNWKEYDTIDKFVGFGVEWWNQTVDQSGNAFAYDISSNKITYKFCADKIAVDIPVEETTRTQPGIPRTSNGVSSLGKSILLSNNTYGFQPIDPAEMSKITYGITTPEVTCSAPPTRTVQFYAVIYNPSHLSGDGICDIFLDGTVYGFRSPETIASIDNGDQIFGDQKNPGFVFYVAGQPQYNCITERGALDTTTFSFTPLPIGTGAPAGTVVAHRGTILVPASKGIIRCASHKVKVTENNIQNTSTTVCGIGVLNDINTGLNSYASNPLKEIEFDCSASNVLSGDLFIIMDMSKAGTASAGYLKEDVSVNSGQGIEMQPVWFTATIGGVETANFAWGSFLTDHNGFYFSYYATPSPISNGGLITKMTLDVCDGTGANKTVILTNNNFRMLYGYGTGTAIPGSAPGTAGNYLNAVSYYVGTNTYPSSGRRKMIIQNLIAAAATPAPGIPAVVTKGSTDITDTNGIIQLILHNRYDYATVYTGLTLPVLASNVPSYADGSGREDDNVIYSQKGGCTWNYPSCGSYTRANILYPYIPCNGAERVFNYLYPVYFYINGFNIKGVQSGGRYGLGWLFYDRMGRHTFVQTQQGDSAFVTVPNINDITTDHPVPTFGLSSISYSIASDFQVPEYFVAMTPCVTENLLFSDFFSWAADWVQFVDNSGNNNTSNPTFVRIYYQSLNEYNKQNNFATNTGWEVITTAGSNTSPVVGDVIQFIRNGVGDDTTSWFTAPLSAPISYDKNGAFITVEYTNAMASITNGCLFRVIRPKQSNTNNIYYEQNYVIKLVGGQVADSSLLTGTLPYYDSYMLNRSLPVPILKGQPGPIPPGQQAPSPIQYSSSGDTTITEYVTDNTANNNNVVQMSLVDAATTFPFFFESPSPSDFWGSHLANRGRPQTKNPYEAEYRLGTEFLLSAALGDRPNSFNGLSYYTSANSKIFDRNQYGNITAVIVETGTCLVICEADHFTTMYNQSTMYVTSDGTVNAQNTDGSLFTNPIKKVGQDYGCSLEYINTIRSNDGIVMWLDPRGRLVKCDYSNAKDVSESGMYYGFILNTIAEVKTSNQSGVLGLSYFISMVDPKTKEYHLSTFNIPQEGLPEYINTKKEPKIALNSTTRIDVITGIMKGMSSYTPEYYGSFRGFESQVNLFSFKNGIPWSHHTSNLGNPYINFYGTQCEAAISGIVNTGDDLVKRYLWMEVYCKSTLPIENNFSTPMFFIEDGYISTEKGQLSRLLTPQWSYSNGFAKAPFLCDLNTPLDPNIPVQTGVNAIRDGNTLQGRWLQYTLRTQEGYSGAFFKLTSVIVFVNHVKKSGA